MWPFTSRRIFGNRWWAVGFVAFVCWQVADAFGDATPVNSMATSPSETAVDDAQMNAMAATLDTLQKMK